MKNIESFDGDYRWLSNFWLCPVQMGGMIYPSTENAYQAAKFRKADRAMFLTCSPGEAKRLGGVVELPRDWDRQKLKTMKAVLKQKFRQGGWEEHLLLATGDAEIIEGNTWGDTFWGVCWGIGENRLGKMIMEIRDDRLA